MNCRDLEELLSAYADGELSRTQREFIEEHLSNCAGCRETLAEFEATGRQLASLRETPAASDISKSTISKIKAANIRVQKPKWYWLLHACVVTPEKNIDVVLLANSKLNKRRDRFDSIRMCVRVCGFAAAEVLRVLRHG